MMDMGEDEIEDEDGWESRKGWNGASGGKIKQVGQEGERSRVDLRRGMRGHFKIKIMMRK